MSSWRKVCSAVLVLALVGGPLMAGASEAAGRQGRGKAGREGRKNRTPLTAEQMIAKIDERTTKVLERIESRRVKVLQRLGSVELKLQKKATTQAPASAAKTDGAAKAKAGAGKFRSRFEQRLAKMEEMMNKREQMLEQRLSKSRLADAEKARVRDHAHKRIAEVRQKFNASKTEIVAKLDGMSGRMDQLGSWQ